MCAVSCAIINALVNPSSLFRAQLLFGSQTPATGAYPDGPPMSDLVNHMAKSCRGSSAASDAWMALFQELTFSKDFLALPILITL